MRISAAALLVPVLLALLPGSASAFGYLDAHGNGTVLPGFSAVSIGLGGAKAVGFGDALSVLTNPADIYRIPGTSLTLSVGPGVIREMVEDSLGKHDRTWMTLANLSGGAKFQAGPSIAVAAGIAAVSDFSYDGMHYTYDDDPGPQYGQITEVRHLRVTGGLWESAAGVAWRPATWINVGVSAGLRFGSVSFDSTFEDRTDSLNDAEVSWTIEESAPAWHAGIALPLDLARIGVCWASGTDHFDPSLTAGALLYTDDARQAAFGAEAEIADPGDANALTVRILGQFLPSPGFTVRGSFFFMDRADEVEREGMGLAVGTGIALGKITLNGGFSWSSVDRSAVAFGYEAPEDIKDSASLLSVGLTWNP